MASAKQSELDKLHALYTKELLRQLKEDRTDENGERVAPSASLLAVIGKFLLSSGVKPTNDNPSIAELSKLVDLPFKADGTPNDDNKVVN